MFPRRVGVGGGVWCLFSRNVKICNPPTIFHLISPNSRIFQEIFNILVFVSHLSLSSFFRN